MQKHSVISRIDQLLLFLFLVCLCSGFELKAQSRYKVLFLGNSYTYVNNLPQMIHDAALSAGDTLVFDSYAPGGYQLMDHRLDVNSQNKIMAGGWDYVVIQGQSQEPIIYPGPFNNGGSALQSLIKQYNPCAVIMPYMTWGRKNGDAPNCPNIPVMCTYQGMDTTLRNCYLSLTAAINGEVSPVSVVWNYLRQNHPGIELYDPDESHPSLAGSYAAACCFYTAIFKKDPTGISFNSGLNAANASLIRNAAKTKVFNSLPSWDFKKLPTSNFSYYIGSGTNQVIFNPITNGVRQTYLWDFGDGTTATSINPTHSYAANGTYTVSLTTTTCDLQGLQTSFTDTVIQFCSHTPTIYSPLPWLCGLDTLLTQPADSYQWFVNGVPIPETGRYIANYARYGISGFSVQATVNGCSELSEMYAKTPEWSGYYFDAIGDPCAGDTVAFAVLHINGFLSGQEKILWFKNDTLLPLMTQSDTLLITAAGKYECKVIDPLSRCPLDTTSYVIQYNCSPSGITETSRELSWVLYPNPASQAITLQFKKDPVQEQVEVYSTSGYLLKQTKALKTTVIQITDLPNGLYFVRLKNSSYPPLKFIKK